MQQQPPLSGATRPADGPKVLVIATVHWAATTRLCLAMSDVGFDVHVLAPEHHALCRLGLLGAQEIGRTRRKALTSILAVIERDRPDLLVPGDEGAILLLRQLYTRAVCGKVSDPTSVAGLIEASLGSASSLAFGRQKTRLIALATKLGILTPATTVVDDVADLRRLLAAARFPMVLKRDESSGGQAVRIVNDAHEAEQAFVELRSAAGIRAALKQAVKRLDSAYLERSLHRPPSIALQQYIPGRPANRAVFCWRGQVLGGLSVEALHTCSTTGPATVVRFIDCPAMTLAASQIVSHLGLAGFVGFDFVIEEGSGEAYLIELNARPTQICHLAVRGHGEMLKSLHRVLAPDGPVPELEPISAETVALFPQEKWRDAASPNLRTSVQDVPWNWPAIVDAYAKPVAEEPTFWTDRISRAVRSMRRPAQRRLAVKPPQPSSPAAPVDNVAPISLP